jgi:predicted Rossmann fold nucleotide-binding protein DprA/Smf involved in DNA uptake
MKLAVVGGRDFNNYSLLKNTLDYIHKHNPITMIISGGATGADEMAYRYAIDKGITFVCQPPLEEEKKEMGFARAAKRRNLRIVIMADSVIAYPTKNSKGTWHTVSLAEKLNKRVTVID